MNEISAEEMAIIDINSEYRGVPRSKLMVNAGTQVTGFIEKIIENLHLNSPKIAIFCHTGGNGGDGFVAANLLSKFSTVEVYFTGTEKNIKSKSSLRNFKILKEKRKVRIIEMLTSDKILDLDINSYDIIVDALLGTGLSHYNLKNPVKSAINKINEFNKDIISIDVPSGLLKNGTCAEIIVNTKYTVSLHKPKYGTYKYGGNIEIADIGIPKSSEVYTGPGLFTLLPNRKKISHKGQNGKLLIIGGSSTYHGAPILSAKSALALNVDLVTLVVPESIVTAVRSQDIRYIVYPYKETCLTKEIVNSVIKPLIDKNDVILIGPGLGNQNDSIEAVQHLLSLITSKHGLVIDADGLKAINPTIQIPGKCILTPHVGEFKIISGKMIKANLSPEEKLEILKKSIASFNPDITWLLKGMIDLVVSTDKFLFNDTGIPEMTVGGTGDILAGLTAGFLCLVNDTFTSASLASFLIGKASELQKNERGWFSLDLLFEDLIKTIIEIHKFIHEEKNLIFDMIYHK